MVRACDAHALCAAEVDRDVERRGAQVQVRLPGRVVLVVRVGEIAIGELGAAGVGEARVGRDRLGVGLGLGHVGPGLCRERREPARIDLQLAQEDPAVVLGDAEAHVACACRDGEVVVPKVVAVVHRARGEGRPL